MKRLQTLLDKFITNWLHQVVELSETEQPNRWRAESAGRTLTFHVLTPAMQRQLDHSA